MSWCHTAHTHSLTLTQSECVEGGGCVGNVNIHILWTHSPFLTFLDMTPPQPLVGALYCAVAIINARQKLTTVACINKLHTAAAQAFSQYCSAVIPGKVF